MTDPDCVFCKIQAGRIPCARVYEDEHSLAFLDIAPFEEGHTLLIPKYHAATLLDLPADVLVRFAPALQHVSRLLHDRLPCDGFNLLQSNGRCATQVVPHVHFHVVPRWDGRPVRWLPGTYASNEAMQALAARLRVG